MRLALLGGRLRLSGGRLIDGSKSPECCCPPSSSSGSSSASASSSSASSFSASAMSSSSMSSSIDECPEAQTIGGVTVGGNAGEVDVYFVMLQDNFDPGGPCFWITGGAYEIASCGCDPEATMEYVEGYYGKPLSEQFGPAALLVPPPGDACEDPFGTDRAVIVDTIPCPPAAKMKAKAAPAGGVGTELKKLLARIGIRSSPSCSCNARAREMDAKGVSWCDKNLEKIVGWLREESKRRRVPFVPVAGRLLIRRAIANARRAGYV
jgi:hypothetical protein